MPVKCEYVLVWPNRENFKLYKNTSYSTEDNKKNKKIKKNLSKVSYRMLYNFLNRNIYYFEYFVPDLNNYLEAEHKKSLHNEKTFKPNFDEDSFLTLLKTDSFGSKPILNLLI